MKCFCHVLPRWLQHQSLWCLVVNVSGMMTCDSYQECGGMEPIPSVGSGHWAVSRPSSIPVGNDTIYWRCDGRRVKMKGAAHPQGNGTRGPNLSWHGWWRTGTLNLRLIRRNGQLRSFEVRPPFWPKRSHCLVTVHSIFSCKSNKYWRYIIEIVFCASILLPVLNTVE